jgi:hypothetical protein
MANAIPEVFLPLDHKHSMHKDDVSRWGDCNTVCRCEMPQRWRQFRTESASQLNLN